MKRQLIALAIILVIVGSGSRSLWQFSQLRKEASPLFQKMEGVTETEAFPQAAAAATDFLQLWETHQRGLCRYLRREALEQIGRRAVRLPQLAQHRDLAEFSATVQELQYYLNELWESELPQWNHLF